MVICIMRISSRQKQDLKKIMSWDDEMVTVLSKNPGKSAMNAWMRQLPGIFRGLHLRRGMTVLDMPSGNGLVSVPLAKKFGVKVIGFDIIPEYVAASNKLAKKTQVERLCTFKVADIRSVVQKKNICDLFLWIAAPNLWKGARNTIKMLRTCVKSGGLILMGDAYIYSARGKKFYPDYELLPMMQKGFEAYGDRIIRFIDYKDRLWDSDYKRCFKETQRDFLAAKTVLEKKIYVRRLAILRKEQKTDKNHLGLGIWIVRVNK